MSSSTQAAERPAAELPIGAYVVYGGFGIGRISRRRSSGSGGSRSETVVIEFPSGLSVTLPFEQACACLRPLSGEAEVLRVQQTLRSHESGGEDSWQNRRKSAQSKIVAGDLIALAEVVRDAARRAGQTAPGGGPVRISSYEQELSVQARHLLATELAIWLGTNETAASEWIDHELSLAARTA